MLVVESGGRISIISSADMTVKRTFSQEGSVIDCAVMRKDAKAATSSSNNTIKLWDIREGKLLLSMTSSRMATSIDFE